MNHPATPTGPFQRNLIMTVEAAKTVEARAQILQKTIHWKDAGGYDDAQRVAHCQKRFRDLLGVDDGSYVMTSGGIDWALKWAQTIIQNSLNHDDEITLKACAILADHCTDGTLRHRAIDLQFLIAGELS